MTDALTQTLSKVFLGQGLFQPSLSDGGSMLIMLMAKLKSTGEINDIWLWFHSLIYSRIPMYSNLYCQIHEIT